MLCAVWCVAVYGVWCVVKVYCGGDDKVRGEGRRERLYGVWCVVLYGVWRGYMVRARVRARVRVRVRARVKVYGEG